MGAPMYRDTPAINGTYNAFTKPLVIEGARVRLKSMTVKTPAVPDTVMWIPEVPPKFPGGDQALVYYLQSSIKYPAMETDSSIRIQVIVRFIVNLSGQIERPVIVKSGGIHFDQEVLRVVQQLPAFSPARHNGEPVEAYFMLPVDFERR